MLLRLLAFTTTVLIGLTSFVQAQPKPVREIPPPGIEIPGPKRAQLNKKRIELTKKISILKQKKNAEIDRLLPAELAAAGQKRGQRLPFDQFVGDISLPLPHVAAEAADDMRMLQPLEERHFVAKEKPAVEVGGQRDRQDLEGDLPPLLDMNGAVDLTAGWPEALFQGKGADS